MSRTTSLPEPRTSRSVRLLLAGAVTATALVGVGAASADDLNPWALTSADQRYLSTESPGKLTLTGKGFTDRSVVTFTYCTSDNSEGTPADATGEAAEKKGTKLVLTPPACPAGAKPRIKVVTGGVQASTRTLYNSKITYVEKPVLAAIGAPAKGPWTGGTSATITLSEPPGLKAVVQVKLGGAKPVAAKVSADDPKVFTFKTPAGTPGRASAQVFVFGIPSAVVDDAFDYLSTIKVSPNTWVTGAAKTPVVKIAGAGFGTNPAAVKVSFCGTSAAVTAVTDKAITVAPPALSAVSALAEAKGGACTVVVDVDVDPSATGERTSLPTAGSTFTYAAY